MAEGTGVNHGGLTREDIREVIESALNDHLIDLETHRAHHQAVALWLQRQEERRQRWERLKERIIGWAVLSGFGAAIGGLGFAFIEWVKRSMRDGG